MSAADQPATTSLTGISAPPPTSGGRAWLGSYLRRIILADLACALAAGELAAQARFSWMAVPLGYDGLMCVLPLLWVAAVGLASGYDSRFIGLGSDEFRKVLNAAVGLTVMLGLVSYVGKLEIARGYLVVALPVTCCLNLCARFVLRKRLHRGRRLGRCAQRVVVVGHAAAVADLAVTLRRDRRAGRGRRLQR